MGPSLVGPRLHLGDDVLRPLPAQEERLGSHRVGRSSRFGHQLPESAQTRRDEVGRAPEEEAVARLGTPPQRGIAEPPDPERDRFGRAREDPGAGDRVELAVEADDGLRPQPTQQFDLFVRSSATGVEVLTEGVVLDPVPAHPDADTEPVARQDRDVGGLPGEQRGLALREDEDAGRELESLGTAGEVREQDERIVEGIVFVVRARQRRLSIGVLGAEHMVVGDEVIEAEIFGRSPDAPDGVGVTAQLDLGVDDAGSQLWVQHRLTLPRADVSWVGWACTANIPLMGEGPMGDGGFAEPDRARFIDVNRTRIRAWCWGDPAAPPVLLAHGAHDHGRMWDDFAPRLASVGFHVVAIDMRGHGDSGRLDSGMMWTASTLDLCELARVLADEAGTPGEPIGMIGHSMGGGQVLSAAGTTPERVAWIVNLDGLGPPGDAFPDLEPVEGTTAAIDRIVRVLGRPPRLWSSPAEMATRRGAINVRLPQRFLDHLVVHGTVETEGGFVSKTDRAFDLGVPDGFSVDAVLDGFGDVSAPVLALMSSEDDAWTELDDEEVERRIAVFPDARWRSVPGAGHYVHVENPDFVLREIVGFLGEIGVLRDTAAERVANE